jgi:hypothetical protein
MEPSVKSISPYHANSADSSCIVHNKIIILSMNERVIKNSIIIKTTLSVIKGIKTYCFSITGVERRNYMQIWCDRNVQG